MTSMMYVQFNRNVRGCLTLLARWYRIRGRIPYKRKDRGTMLMPFLQPLVAETVRESFLHTETSLFDKAYAATASNMVSSGKTAVPRRRGVGQARKRASSERFDTI